MEPPEQQMRREGRKEKNAAVEDWSFPQACEQKKVVTEP